MEDVSVVVLSCDKYADCQPIFYSCFKKYWPTCTYPLYLVTETKKFDKISTININSDCWTTRVREALKKISSKYVIILLDDFFIRSEVDVERIHYCVTHFNQSIATFNFELEYSYNLDSDLVGFRERPPHSFCMHSCQPSIWNRCVLIEELKKSQTPWEWEADEIQTNYRYFINSSKKFIIDIGYYPGKPFSIVKGKWTKEVIKFFEKEGIKVDYSIRGIYD